MKTCPVCFKEFSGNAGICDECFIVTRRKKLNELSKRFTLLLLIAALIYANSKDMEGAGNYIRRRSKRAAADFSKLWDALKEMPRDFLRGVNSRDSFTGEPGYLKGRGERPRNISPGDLGGGGIENFTRQVYSGN
jgi:hypothetical protein